MISLRLIDPDYYGYGNGDPFDVGIGSGHGWNIGCGWGCGYGSENGGSWNVNCIEAGDGCPDLYNSVHQP